MKTINLCFTSICDSLACWESTTFNNANSIITNCRVFDKNNPIWSREDCRYTFMEYLASYGVYVSTIFDNIFDINIEHYWKGYTDFCSANNVKVYDDTIEALNEYYIAMSNEYGQPHELLQEYDEKLAAYLESKYGSLYDFEAVTYGNFFWKTNEKD